MKTEHAEILKVLGQFLEENPEQRFGQALFNLHVNEFQEGGTPGNYRVRDIYSDWDREILERATKAAREMSNH